MRSLLIVTLVAALAWSGWWWVGSGREQSEIRAWFDRTEGASAAAISTGGFPNRFDTTMTKPALQAGGFRWTAPVLELLRLSYRPGHYILALPPSQTIVTPDRTIDIVTGQARASIGLGASGPDQISFVADDLQATTDLGWVAKAQQFLYATRPSGDGTEVGIELRTIEFDGKTFDLHLRGVLTRDGNGGWNGDMELKTGNWPVLLNMLGEFGLSRDTIIALARPSQAEVETTLSLSDGMLSLDGRQIGPFPVLPLP